MTFSLPSPSWLLKLPNEKEIPGVWLIFTVNARSLNPKVKQIVHFWFFIFFFYFIGILEVTRSYTDEVLKVKVLSGRTGAVVFKQLKNRKSTWINLLHTFSFTKWWEKSIHRCLLVLSCSNLAILSYLAHKQLLDIRPCRRWSKFLSTIDCKKWKGKIYWWNHGGKTRSHLWQRSNEFDDAATLTPKLCLAKVISEAWLNKYRAIGQIKIR